jgi:hypothetical protein
MVENVHSGEQHAFSTLQELWHLLRQPAANSSRRPPSKPA